MITYNDLMDRMQGKDYGKYFTTFCPFHSDHSSPSMMVFKDGWFRCLSANCNRNGSWKILWNKISGQPIKVHPETRTIFTAPTNLDDYVGLPELCDQAHEDLEQFSSWQWYMEQRGLSDSIEIAEIGYHRGWYTFPVYDRDHNFQTAVFRAAPHVQEVTGLRYWCHHRPMMYVPDWNKLRNPEFIIVVFGILDALTINKFRYPVVTSTAGADTFNADWLDEWRVPIFVIQDKAESTSALKLISRLGWRGHSVQLDYPKGCKDPNDFLKIGQEKNLEAQLTHIGVKHATHI